ATLALPRLLPEHARREGAALPYPQLMRSLPGLLREHRDMRMSAWLGSWVYAVFSAFWTTVTLLLIGPPFHGGPEYPGTLALVALPGAVLASRMGRLCDRSGPAVVNALGLAIVALGLAILGLFAGTSLIALAIGANVLTFGAVASAIANQTRIFRLGLPI